MRNYLFVIVLGLMVMTAGAASATYWDNFTGSADCEGWEMEGGIRMSSVYEYLTVYYTIDISQDGVSVAQYTGETIVPSSWPLITQFTDFGAWDIELCGIYEITGSFNLPEADLDNVQTFTTTIDCECDEPSNACQLTPGFWKNHRNMWAVQTMYIGGHEYDADALMAFLKAPVRGDATIILLHHLIAAKLNVASGADDSIMSAIDEASDLLATYEPGSRPGKHGKRMLIRVKNQLRAYNEMGCPGGYNPLTDGDKAMSEDLDFEGATGNWGDLKALYR
jgi:hypothetical protein